MKLKYMRCRVNVRRHPVLLTFVFFLLCNNWRQWLVDFPFPLITVSYNCREKKIYPTKTLLRSRDITAHCKEKMIRLSVWHYKARIIIRICCCHKIEKTSFLSENCVEKILVLLFTDFCKARRIVQRGREWTKKGEILNKRK